MCTLAVAFRSDRRFPLVVAANRDERVARPSETWALRDGPSGRFAAPRDTVAGGTWIGTSPTGVFAAVTNFHSGAATDHSLRSRGGLVPFALAAPDAAEARRRIAALDAAAFNPFHLLVADAEAAFLWRWDGERAALAALEPGLHVVTERSADGRDSRGEVVRARWPLDGAPLRLSALLSTHAPPCEAVCVHGEPLYATRSSTILRLAGSLAASELWVADGPPCRTPFEDRSDLLARLAPPPGRPGGPA